MTPKFHGSTHGSTPLSNRPSNHGILSLSNHAEPLSNPCRTMSNRSTGSSVEPSARVSLGTRVGSTWPPGGEGRLIVVENWRAGRRGRRPNLTRGTLLPWSHSIALISFCFFGCVANLLQRHVPEMYLASMATVADDSPPGMRKLGPQSRAIDRGTLGEIDGRSREGRFLRAYEAMMMSHLGGSPSRIQGEMIRRCARLALHLELQDEKTLRGGEAMSEFSSRAYVAWHRALMSSLRLLGAGGVGKPTLEPSGPSLAEYLASKAAAA